MSSQDDMAAVHQAVLNLWQNLANIADCLKLLSAPNRPNIDLFDQLWEGLANNVGRVNERLKEAEKIPKEAWRPFMLKSETVNLCGIKGTSHHNAIWRLGFRLMAESILVVWPPDTDTPEHREALTTSLQRALGFLNPDELGMFDADLLVEFEHASRGSASGLETASDRGDSNPGSRRSVNHKGSDGNGTCMDARQVPALSERQYNVLTAMLMLQAVSASERMNSKEIAKKAENAGPECLERALSGLVKLGLICSHTGRGGGYWLSEEGRRVAEPPDASGGIQP
jgi:hypothetical protein